MGEVRWCYRADEMFARVTRLFLFFCSFSSLFFSCVSLLYRQSLCVPEGGVCGWQSHIYDMHVRIFRFHVTECIACADRSHDST